MLGIQEFPLNTKSNDENNPNDYFQNQHNQNGRRSLVSDFMMCGLIGGTLLFVVFLLIVNDIQLQRLGLYQYGMLYALSCMGMGIWGTGIWGTL